MQKFAKQIWISAPPDLVFETLVTPDTWSRIMPGIIDPTPEDLDEPRYRLEFTYKLLGVRTNRALELVEVEPGTQLVFDLSGGMQGSYTFDITEQGTGTRLRFDAQYQLSNAVLDRVLRRFAVRYNNRQFDALLANLKDYVELRKTEINPSEAN